MGSGPIFTSTRAIPLKFTSLHRSFVCSADYQTVITCLIITSDYSRNFEQQNIELARSSFLTSIDRARSRSARRPSLKCVFSSSTMRAGVQAPGRNLKRHSLRCPAVARRTLRLSSSSGALQRWLLPAVGPAACRSPSLSSGTLRHKTHTPQLSPMRQPGLKRLGLRHESKPPFSKLHISGR